MSLAANKFEKIAGILNGTTNYILTKMEEEGLSYEAALAQAQALGFAEKDPTADVEGHDACRKICILAALCFGNHVYPKNVHCEGITKIYDVKPLFEKLPVFVYFKEHEDEFYGVTTDVGGYGIVWNDDLDLSCDELWERGVQVDTPFDGLMSFADATQLWGLNESTLRKAIAYGKLINGVDVCKFGKQWVVSVEAMKREYGEAKNGKRA